MSNDVRNVVVIDVGYVVYKVAFLGSFVRAQKQLLLHDATGPMNVYTDNISLLYR